MNFSLYVATFPPLWTATLTTDLRIFTSIYQERSCLLENVFTSCQSSRFIMFVLCVHLFCACVLCIFVYVCTISLTYVHTCILNTYIRTTQMVHTCIRTYLYTYKHACVHMIHLYVHTKMIRTFDPHAYICTYIRTYLRSI